VHVLAVGDRVPAERFSEIRPRSEARSIGWRWPSRHGARCSGKLPTDACRLPGSAPGGDAELVEGLLEELELPDLDNPLAYLHGSYRSVRELEEHG
jgi:hypothetical protein